MTGRETERWPFIQARWYTRVGASKGRNVRVIGIHDMEFFERGDTAEVIARDFNTRPETSKASAHVCVDNNSVVQCVYDSDVAYAAPGANHDGIHIELAGFKAQTRVQWLDQYSVAVLALGADVAAQYCIKYQIPARQLTDKQLADGRSKGIVGHDQISRVFKQSDHTDPGKAFPWDVFIAMVAQFVKDRTQRIA